MKRLAKRLALLAFAALLLGVIPAVARDVRCDFDKDKAFSKYKTYKWVTIKDADQPDDLTARQIVAALDAKLATKGLTKTNSDSADLYIGSQTAVGAEKQFTAYNTGWGYGPGWRRGWYGYGGMTTTTTYGSTSTIYVGQLDLSMYDSAQKQLVWRGVARKTLDPWLSRTRSRRTLRKRCEGF